MTPVLKTSKKLSENPTDTQFETKGSKDLGMLDSFKSAGLKPGQDFYQLYKWSHTIALMEHVFWAAAIALLLNTTHSSSQRTAHSAFSAQ